MPENVELFSFPEKEGRLRKTFLKNNLIPLTILVVICENSFFLALAIMLLVTDSKSYLFFIYKLGITDDEISLNMVYCMYRY